MLAATIVCAGLLCGSAAVAARPVNRHPKPKVEKAPASNLEDFTTAGANGFTVTVQVRNRHRLVVTAVPPGGSGFIATSYSLDARQARGSDGIEANLGGLGRIAVRFVPESSYREKLPSHCKGRRTTVEEGHFVGRIDFHGEGGYTDVHSTRAFGSTTTTPALTCRSENSAAELKKLIEALEKGGKEEKGGAAEEPEFEAHAFKLNVKLKGRPITFTAARDSAREPDRKGPKGKGESFASFSVIATRHRGRIAEGAFAIQLFEPGSKFEVPDLTHLTREVVVKPAAPFSGSATLRRESPRSASWTGDLSVELPGFGEVHLAGPGTRATLCADAGCGT